MTVGLLFDTVLLASLMRTRRKVDAVERAVKDRNRGGWFDPKEPRDFEMWPPKPED